MPFWPSLPTFCTFSADYKWGSQPISYSNVFFYFNRKSLFFFFFLWIAWTREATWKEDCTLLIDPRFEVGVSIVHVGIIISIHDKRNIYIDK